MLVLTKVSLESKGIEFERHVDTALKKKKKLLKFPQHLMLASQLRELELKQSTNV